MKKVVTVVTPAILPVGVASIGSGDDQASAANTSISSDEVTSSISMTDDLTRECHDNYHDDRSTR